MPNDHSPSQGRRPHYHRGRRGGRPADRRPSPGPQEPSSRDHVDVEQIMRDIRSRIARRHGIDLTPQQIHELAARRLEAILEPRHVAPSLMEQMRRAAGEAIDVPSAQAEAVAEFDESAIYSSHRGFLSTMRRWLNPILKLFFNPTPLVNALRDQTRRSNAAAARETELYARQAEWNALHFEILQRLVTEVSRATIDVQTVSARIESLAAKVDFNERRVRGLEGSTAATPARSAPRPEPGSPDGSRPSAAPNPDGLAPAATAAGVTEGTRRRRRRRRGRRGPGPSFGEPSTAGVTVAQTGRAESPDVDAGPDEDGDIDGETEFDAEGEGQTSSSVPIAVDATAERRELESLPEPHPAPQASSTQVEVSSESTPRPDESDERDR